MFSFALKEVFGKLNRSFTVSDRLAFYSSVKIINNESDILKAKHHVDYDTSTPNGKCEDEGDCKEEAFIGFIPGNRRTAPELNQEILGLLKKRKLKEALQLFEMERKEDKIKPLRAMHVHLIGACGKAGYTKKAFHLFNDLKKRGWNPTPSTYTALFNACANSPWIEDGLSRATKLRNHIKEKRIELNILQYHAMIKAFGHCKDIDTVAEIVNEIVHKKLPLSTETFNFIFQACLSQPRNGFLLALMNFHRMQSLGVSPDIYSYNLILRSVRDCTTEDNKEDNKEDNFQEERFLGHDDNGHVLKMIHSESIQSENDQDFSYLVAHKHKHDLPLVIPKSSHERLKLLGGVDGFLKRMEKDSVTPDVKTLTLLLQTAATNQDQELFIIEYANKRRIVLDVDFFNVLIKRCQLRQDTNGVMRVLKLLQERKLHPNIMTYGVLALGCSNVNDAITFIKYLDNSGFRMNIEIYGSLLKNAVIRQDCDYIIYLMNRAVEWDLTLNEKAVILLENFKNSMTKRIAVFDRQNETRVKHGEDKFRAKFKIFCFNYSRWLKKLHIELQPHPWKQYRY